MANVQLVETSLRDGNQWLWSALGVDTARSLTIAPVMDRVGFKAIDFTTSTHMGVAVRYKKEDPWERIRLMAKAMPNTPLQFLSTGFRFISWETASPEFMALAFQTLVNNGMRRFALADPMNDADSNVACARMVKAAGGEYVIGALVFTLSPIHDDAHYVECARTLAASPDIDALYIKDPGGLLTPLRARTLIPGVKAAIGNKPWNSTRTAPSASASWFIWTRRLGRQRSAMRLGRGRDGISNPQSDGSSPIFARWASRGRRRRSPRRSRAIFHSPGRSGRPARGPPQAFEPAISTTNCRAEWSAPCAATWPNAGCPTWKVRSSRSWAACARNWAGRS